MQTSCLYAVKMYFCNPNLFKKCQQLKTIAAIQRPSHRAESRVLFKKNQKSLGFIALGIVILVLLYFGYQQFYLAPRAEKASNELFKAESYAQIDSLQSLAIKGDGSYPGFEQIADEYSNTPSANIANAY